MRFLTSLRRLSVTIGLFGIAGASLSGCGGGGSNPVVTPPAGRAAWTVLVYMNAANNLQPDSITNIAQMLKVGSTADLNIIVQWKQAACFDCGTSGTRTFVGTHRYRVPFDANGTVANIEAGRLADPNPNGTVDMGSAATLKSFVEWGVQQYPATHVALVIWDHGSGWIPTRAANRLKPPATRAFSQDDDSGHEIQNWELAGALSNVAPIDMIIFDASLEQMLENAYEVRASAKLMVGSEESPPGAGYPYDQWLGPLKQNATTMTPLQVGQTIVNTFVANYPAETDITQSILDLSKMQTTANALDAFARALLAHVNDQGAVIASARNNAQHYTPPYDDNKDLFDFAARIAANSTANDLKTAAQAMQTALTGANGSILLSAHGNFNQSGSNGLAIYIPSLANFTGFYQQQYTNLALGRTTQWDEFLAAQTQ